MSGVPLALTHGCSTIVNLSPDSAVHIKHFALTALLISPLATAHGEPQTPSSGSYFNDHMNWYLGALGAGAAVFTAFLSAGGSHGTSQSEVTHLPTPPAPQAGGILVAESATDGQGNQFLATDQVQQTTTAPEPATAMLVATALVGLAGTARRRKS